jgi:hypothetical protein
MKRIVIATAMSLCVVLLAVIASADTLILTDGTRVPGRVVSVAARTITFEDTLLACHVDTTRAKSMRSNSQLRAGTLPQSGRAEAAAESRRFRAARSSR